MTMDYRKQIEESSLLQVVENAVNADKMNMSYIEFMEKQEQFNKALQIVEEHTKACFQFWTVDAQRTPAEALRMTRLDIQSLSGNPFVPDGGEEDLKILFIIAKDIILKEIFEKKGF